MEGEINESQLKVNLEDSIIKEALNSGVDLRQYSQQVEQQLHEVFVSYSLFTSYSFLMFLPRLNSSLLKITSIKVHP